MKEIMTEILPYWVLETKYCYRVLYRYTYEKQNKHFNYNPFFADFRKYFLRAEKEYGGYTEIEIFRQYNSPRFSVGIRMA